MALLDEGFGDRQLRLMTFSWALAFWAFFHFTCDVSNRYTDTHESVRAAGTFFITWPALFVFFVTLFNAAERVIHCNLINGMSCIHCLYILIIMHVIVNFDNN